MFWQPRSAFIAENAARDKLHRIIKLKKQGINADTLKIKIEKKMVNPSKVRHMHIIDARIIVLKKNMSEFLFNKTVALHNRGED